MSMYLKIAWKVTFLFVLAASQTIIDKDTIRQNAKKGQSPFYWQPKLIINMAAPKKAYDLNQVVLLRGYKLGITMMALVEGFPERKKHTHLNPLEAEFYTTAYRWFLRHMELVVPWIYGEAGSYYETVKLWNTRFLMANTFMPKWMQKLLIYIPAEDWEAERTDFQSFTKYAAITFAKHLRYPSNDTRNKEWWKSHESKDSADELQPIDDNKKETPNTTQTDRRMHYTKRSGNTFADASSGEQNAEFGATVSNLNLTDSKAHWKAETAFMEMSESEKQLLFEKFLLQAGGAVQRGVQPLSDNNIGDVDGSPRGRGGRQLLPEALRSVALLPHATINNLIFLLLHPIAWSWCLINL